LDKQLELLINLQDLDLQIQQLEKKEAEIPLQIKELEREIEGYKHAYEAKVQALENLEKNRRKKERELEAKESGLAKLKDQLLSIKTNREYQALLHEIDNIKQEISQLEEEILLMIDESESEVKKVREMKLEMEGSQKLCRVRIEEREQGLVSLRQHKSSLESSRETLRRQISPEWLKQYDKLRKSRGGLAVVSVKDGSCQGCCMSLMPQLFQEIKQNDQIYSCPHCHRIVYYNEEREPEAVG